MRNSLTFRISLFSVAWITLTLVLTAWILTVFYRDHSEDYYDNHALLHLRELLNASSVAPGGSLRLRVIPSDPNFQHPGSGWYWEIRRRDETLAASGSLSGQSLDLGGSSVGSEIGLIETLGPEQNPLRVQSVKFQPPGASRPLTYLSSAPGHTIANDVRDYASHVGLSFLVLGLGLAVAVVIQVRTALRPLRALRRAIGEVRTGRAERLPNDFPRELRPLTGELENLMKHNAALLRRARDQVGDLAHALKNPLTVIRNEARTLPEPQQSLVLTQAGQIEANLERYLSRARYSGQLNELGLRTDVGGVIDDLVFAMRKIHAEQALQITTEVGEDCWFGGDSQDLEEMLGNLLDNACKWAQREVRVSAGRGAGRIRLAVEDDGPGIPEERIREAIQRGNKLDKITTGHGLGLSIVQEDAAQYGGVLKLERSASGGLRAVLDLPAAA